VQHFLAGDDARCDAVEREFSSVRCQKSAHVTASTLRLEQVGSPIVPI